MSWLSRDKDERPLPCPPHDLSGALLYKDMNGGGILECEKCHKHFQINPVADDMEKWLRNR